MIPRYALAKISVIPSRRTTPKECGSLDYQVREGPGYLKDLNKARPPRMPDRVATNPNAE